MGFDPLKKALEFHQKYGGDNGVIDAPEEVTPKMAEDFFFDQTNTTQYLILSQMYQNAGGDINKTQIGNLRLFAGQQAQASICQDRDKQLCDGMEGIFWQFQNDLALGAKMGTSTSSIEPGIAWLILNVVEGGNLKTVAISREELEKNGYSVSVNGYIEGALVLFKNKGVLFFGDEDGHASCGECLLPMTKAKPITRPADKYFPIFSLELGNSLQPSNIVFQFNLIETPMPVTDKVSLLRLLTGGDISAYGSRFFSGGFNKGTKDIAVPLSLEDDIHIQIGNVKETNSIHINQQRATVRGRFYYMVSPTTLEELGDKTRSFEAIVERGIKAVEQAFPDTFEGRVIVTEKNVRQAQAFIHDIVFTTDDIAKEDERWLLMTAEHERLHQAVERLGFISNKEIWKYFEKMKDALSADEKAESLMRVGFEPEGFMKFISEAEFFGVSWGGHPHGNVDEFCTSFIHTLLYPDLLKANLERLPPDERKAILDQYHSILKLFKAAAPERYKHIFSPTRR